MKPKLWDGPTAIGEALSRALDRVATPYLSADGIGVHAKKAGGFAEVTQDPTGQVNAQDGWLSSTDMAQSTAVFTGSPSYRSGFRKRATLTTGGQLSSGTTLAADGNGGARTMRYSDHTGSAYTYVMCELAGEGRRLRDLFEVTVYDGNTAVTGIGGRIVVSGLAVHSDGVPSEFIASTAKQIVSGVSRSKPKLTIAAKGSSGWVTYEVSVPATDTEVPEVALLTPNRIVTAFADYPTDMPKISYSDTFGGSWSAGMSLADLFAGYTDAAAYLTESQIATAHPAYTGNQVRSMFLSQTQVVRYRKTRCGATSIGLVPVGAWLVLVVAAVPYWNGTSNVTAVGLYDLRTGLVRRLEAVSTAISGATGHYRSVSLLGKGAWVDYEYSTFSAQPPRFTWAKVTFDYGVTYRDVTFPTDTVATSIYVMKPYAGSGYRLACVVNPDGRSGTIYVTDDLTTFTPHASIGKPEYVPEGSTSVYNFTRAIWVGSKQSPAPIFPPAPWARDDRYAAPDWWTE